MSVALVRPWYVLGPGHRWPYALLPMYRWCEQIPSTREAAMRLGLVTLEQVVRTLVSGVETPVLARVSSGCQKSGEWKYPGQIR
jgi:hypothetical protein